MFAIGCIIRGGVYSEGIVMIDTLKNKNMLNSNYELGYTPHNLRKILKDNNLKNVNVYSNIGKSRAAFERYLLDVDNPRHAPMSHETWLKVLDMVKDSKV